MKFEIDDKTGMIKIILPKPGSKDLPLLGDGCLPPSSNVVEQILQAVKKTQEKLVNRQIQDIQDSKYDPWAKSSFSPSSKTEQNQKIVKSVKTILETALTQRARLIPLLTDKNPNRDISQKEFDRVCIIIDYLRPMWKYNTGKDIQDL